MLLIPAKIKPSPIHGLGVFTVLPIPKGTTVWQYNSLIDYRRWKKPVTSQEHEFYSKYGYKPFEKDYYEFCGDIAMFLNHSNHPNIDTLEDCGFASRDIKVGEELTVNYFEFDSEPESGGKLN